MPLEMKYTKAASPLDKSKERTQLEQKLKQTVVLQVSQFVLGVFTHCLTLHGNEEEEAKGEASMKSNQIIFFLILNSDHHQQRAPAQNVTVFDMEPGEVATCPGTYWFEVRGGSRLLLKLKCHFQPLLYLLKTLQQYCVVVFVYLLPKDIAAQ